MTVLQIKIGERSSSIVYGGDMAALAREIARICLEHDEFALAMNVAMIRINEELEAIRLRDEMIGMIKNH